MRGWGVTRRTLDPLLRGLAASTPGVEFFPGCTAKRLLSDRGRPTGIEVENRDGSSLRLAARLLVAADGRNSSLARLAGVPGRVRPHNRCFYFSYWRGVERAGTATAAGPSIWLWVPHPDGASEFPNEDGLTVLGAVYSRKRLSEVRADLEGSYLRTLSELPDGPDLRGAERVSKILGKIEVPNVIRPAARPGIAFVGDAALAADPTFGVGISFAFMAAEWLVDETSSVLDSRQRLDDALRRYRRRFAWRLAPHHLQMADFSSAREITRLERRAFQRAAADPVFARAFGKVLARERSVFHLLNPRSRAGCCAPAQPHRRQHEPGANAPCSRSRSWDHRQHHGCAVRRPARSHLRRLLSTLGRVAARDPARPRCQHRLRPFRALGGLGGATSEDALVVGPGPSLGVGGVVLRRAAVPAARTALAKRSTARQRTGANRSKAMP